VSVFDDLSAFVYASPTPFHAVAAAAQRLEAAGFVALDERAPWGAGPNGPGLAPGSYFVARDGALVAFVVPKKTPRGARIVGAHTDSPNLRLKPKPVYSKEGYRQLGVEVYGGALLNSWLDRDLSLAGRVLLRDDRGGIATRLVRIDRPLLRIPQLAIHLDRDVNDKGLVLNRQKHLPPILGLDGGGDFSLEALVAKELGDIVSEQIVALDLQLFDIVPPQRGGLNGEFFFAPRLDNQAMCHAALTGLLEAHASGAASETDVLPMAVLFDNEEVGSDTATGAGSPLVPHLVERILLALGGNRADYLQFLRESLCVSADMAHAVHPNYADRHESHPEHRPRLNGGPVIKVNSQQRYATCARTAAMFARLCADSDVPVQYYAHRTDLPCGSTIGPITATLMGIRTVDVGNPMLSMHSARELSGTADPALMSRVLGRFFTFVGEV
jgi:aspartyl aminopeptidase